MTEKHIELMADGIIHEQLPESLSPSQLDADHTVLQGLIDQVKQTGKPALILVDASQLLLTGITLPARQRAVSSFEALEFERCAVYGANPLVHHVGNFVLLSMRRNRRIKFFNDQAGAIEWLRTANIPSQTAPEL